MRFQAFCRSSSSAASWLRLHRRACSQNGSPSYNLACTTTSYQSAYVHRHSSHLLLATVAVTYLIFLTAVTIIVVLELHFVEFIFSAKAAKLAIRPTLQLSQWLQIGGASRRSDLRRLRPDMAVGPVFVTQTNPTHHFFNPTQPCLLYTSPSPRD